MIILLFILFNFDRIFCLNREFREDGRLNCEEYSFNGDFIKMVRWMCFLMYYL